jgi:prevent-host-death family protein
MKSIAISKIKASLSQYLKIIKAGEEVLITDRGKPVAKMIPVERGDVTISGHLMELERNGLVHIGTGKIKETFWKLPRPADIKGSARKALSRERAASR